MIITDAWGNEFYNKEEAEQYWVNQFWDWMDYGLLADYLNIGCELANWILKDEKRWEDFKKDFKDKLNEAVEQYVTDCYYESEIDDDDE